MMSDKMLCLLDVDGVLIPDPFRIMSKTPPVGYEAHILDPRRYWSRRPFSVWLNPGHGELLMDFAQTYDLELVWATAWCAEASRLIAPLIGLPSLPFIDFDTPDYLSGWKYPQVLKYAFGRPFIWFDDDFDSIRSDVALRSTNFERKRGNLPTFLYCTDVFNGITELDLEVAGKAVNEAYSVS